jgi:selenide,water dikinase
MDIEVLGEILRGGGEKAREAGVVVIGGHSIIDEEVKYGMAVTGEIHPDRVIRNVGVQPGDALVLTKPLGTGIITTALKQRRVTRESIDAAVKSMTTLNATASKIMRNFAVHACSDVTGFALLGHSQEMAAGSDVTIVLESTSLPLLPGAVELAEEGHLTGGCRRNRAYLQDKVVVELSVRPGLVEIGFDPQTSGGLLIALPKAEAPRLVDELQQGGVTASAIVGHAVPHAGTRVQLV